MKAKEMFEILMENFNKRIDRKTGWGKNEIKTEFNLAVAESVFEIVEKDNET